MPRVSRFAVQFPMPSQDSDWVVTFSHQHDSTKGVEYVDAIEGSKPVRVQHITTAKLSSTNDLSKWIKGVSLTSLKDEYDWRLGLKKAFQRCLAKLGYCQEVRNKEGVLIPVANRPGEHTFYAYQDFIPRSEEYGEAMASFYRELPIRGYAPFVVKEGVVVVEPSDAPAETRNGTAHCGMD